MYVRFLVHVRVGCLPASPQPSAITKLLAKEQLLTRPGGRSQGRLWGTSGLDQGGNGGRVRWENKAGKGQRQSGKGPESPESKEGLEHHNTLISLEKGSWALTKIRPKEQAGKHI